MLKNTMIFPESLPEGPRYFCHTHHQTLNSSYSLHFLLICTPQNPPVSSQPLCVIRGGPGHPDWKKHNVFIKFLLFARAQKAKNWQQYHRTAVVTKSSRASSGHPDWKNTMFLANSCFSRELTKVKNYNSTTQYHTFASSRPSGIT